MIEDRKNANIYCPDHSHLFEYVCTNCKSLMCPECVDVHPKHNLFGGADSVVHIFKYAKANIQPIYESALKELATKTVPLADQVPQLKVKVREILASTIAAQEKLKNAYTLLDRLNDELTHILTKAEFAGDPATLQQKVQAEYRTLADALRTGDLATLVQVCKDSDNAINNPRLVPEDIESLEKAATAFKNCMDNGYLGMLEQVDKMTSALQTVDEELKVSGRPANVVLALKECKRDERVVHRSLEFSLKNAINATEVDEVYNVFSEMRRSGFTLPKMLKTCLRTDLALFYLLSYALQQRQINPNDEIFPFMQTYLAKAEARKDMATVGRFQGLMLRELGEYTLVSSVLREGSIRAQDRKVKEFLKIPPKGVYPFSKQCLEHYLHYMEFQSMFACSLLKSKDVKVRTDWAKTMTRLDSVLKVAHYANQIPSLEPQVDKMSKKLDIPKRHMAIIRLKAYGQAGDWKGFEKYMAKEKPKLPPQLIAEICILYKNKEVAIEYIKKIPDMALQMDMFLENESCIEAVEAAVMSKRPELVEELKARVPYDMTPYIQQAEKKLLAKK